MTNRGSIDPYSLRAGFLFHESVLEMCGHLIAAKTFYHNPFTIKCYANGVNFREINISPSYGDSGLDYSLSSIS